MFLLPILQKLYSIFPWISEKKRESMKRKMLFHEWTKGFRRLFRPPFVFLFGSPCHSNLGDQAQTECIVAWIRKYLPKYEIFIATYANTSPRLLRKIRRSIRKKDILLCHSGYHMTDLYDEQSHDLRVAQLFPDHPLTILPQTVNYQEESHAQTTAVILNSHPDCTLFCRDEYSYEKAKMLFNQCRLFLYPDIVTSLIGNVTLPEHSRKGVLFCMRNDKEAFYPPEAIERLRQELEENIPTEQTDTTIDTPAEEVISNRQQILYSTFEYFSQFQAVVTDRYHGAIFSLISNTPVIVLNSSDHKLSSGVKWFPESFSEYVYFAETLNEVPQYVQEIINQPPQHPLPAYFSTEYYDHLLEKLHLHNA